MSDSRWEWQRKKGEHHYGRTRKMDGLRNPAGKPDAVGRGSMVQGSLTNLPVEILPEDQHRDSPG